MDNNIWIYKGKKDNKIWIYKGKKEKNEKRIIEL